MLCAEEATPVGSTTGPISVLSEQWALPEVEVSMVLQALLASAVPALFASAAVHPSLALLAEVA